MALRVYQPVEATKSGYAEISGKDNISKILAILETRNSDRKVLDRVAEKLLTLQGEELRLMSSLCDRISLNHNTAGAEIAFSLIEYAMAMTQLDYITEDYILQSRASSAEEPLKPLREAKNAFERSYLISLLQTCQGNVSDAAELAGKYRADFYSLLNKHNLNAADFRNTE